MADCEHGAAAAHAYHADPTNADRCWIVSSVVRHFELGVLWMVWPGLVASGWRLGGVEVASGLRPGNVWAASAAVLARAEPI